MGEFTTEQEKFWAGQFGDDYIDRNEGEHWVAANTALFSKILSKTEGVNSIIEFGSNIGLNLMALRTLLPSSELSAIELNKKAVKELKRWAGDSVKVYETSMLDFSPDYKRDISFTKGVLIHTNPDVLQKVYELLYNSSRKYICIAEYYNPTPTTVNYRGNENRLFKRDFAGELMEKFTDIELVDYGFAYHGDPNFPQDDLNWFLMKKSNTEDQE